MSVEKQYTLKAIRINNNWTREKMAEMLGVSKDTINNYENFKTFPDVPIIEKILKITGLRYDDIIFLPGNNAKSVNNISNELVQELEELEKEN